MQLTEIKRKHSSNIFFISVNENLLYLTLITCLTSSSEDYTVFRKIFSALQKHIFEINFLKKRSILKLTTLVNTVGYNISRICPNKKISKNHNLLSLNNLSLLFHRIPPFWKKKLSPPSFYKRINKTVTLIPF